MSSLEFLLGLLERDCPAHVAQEDFDGMHGPALRLWRRMGFLGREPGMNPIPSCPACGEGSPYRLQERYVCGRCASAVDRSHLLLWRLDHEAFLAWLAGQWRLRGGVRRIDDRLWQLGTWESHGVVCECFYRRGGPVSDAGRRRLAAHRSALVLYGLSAGGGAEPSHERRVSLLGLLTLGRSLRATDRERLLRRGGEVRFDASSGTLWAGDVLLGEVPVGSKEYHLLRCLAEQPDHFVSYSDIKYYVLRNAGSADSNDEATFCHDLKRRIKKKWIPQIDLLLATTNKGDGYRLRAYADPVGSVDVVIPHGAFRPVRPESRGGSEPVGV